MSYNEIPSIRRRGETANMYNGMDRRAYSKRVAALGIISEKNISLQKSIPRYQKANEGILELSVRWSSESGSMDTLLLVSSDVRGSNA